ncbi:hypothetical protein BLA29_012468 [Euroglyphus maynei]|uniref:Uncharacterized protein n=1 Tax=Euroglyphus maynei TaxID=6958 RepID=A0A1Y3B470_EURMA|nr:hypothetical protein BLA29_012468 [Euroglyphus maynei]
MKKREVKNICFYILFQMLIVMDNHFMQKMLSLDFLHKNIFILLVNNMCIKFRKQYSTI